MYISDESEISSIREIILSKNLFRNKGLNQLGLCDKFENSFAQVIGANHCLMVSSGTNALTCALASLNLNFDDEVIIPSFTFFATAVAVINSNATPIIVDIDTSLSIDPKSIENAITKKTKAIVAVHMDGHSADLDSIIQICAKYNLILIEDVAQSCGGKYQGKRLGSFGEVGCFSFNVSKIISCGEGGALVTNSREIYEKSLCIQDACCSFGSTHRDSFTQIKPFIGQSMRVSEISGAIMSVQLNRLDFILDQLRKRQKIMNNIFADKKIKLTSLNETEGDCGTSLNLLFDDPIICKNIFLKLFQENIISQPATSRPAHACWQWTHLLSDARPGVNYHKGNYLKSIDLLSRILKIEVPFDMEFNEIENYALKITEIIKKNS